MNSHVLRAAAKRAGYFSALSVVCISQACLSTAVYERYRNGTTRGPDGPRLQVSAAEGADYFFDARGDFRLRVRVPASLNKPEHSVILCPVLDRDTRQSIYAPKKLPNCEFEGTPVYPQALDPGKNHWLLFPEVGAAWELPPGLERFFVAGRGPAPRFFIGGFGRGLPRLPDLSRAYRAFLDDKDRLFVDWRDEQGRSERFIGRFVLGLGRPEIEPLLDGDDSRIVHPTRDFQIRKFPKRLLIVRNTRDEQTMVFLLPDNARVAGNDGEPPPVWPEIRLLSADIPGETNTDWLWLMPVAVLGDLVTSPFQLIYNLMTDRAAQSRCMTDMLFKGLGRCL